MTKTIISTLMALFVALLSFCGTSANSAEPSPEIGSTQGPETAIKPWDFTENFTPHYMDVFRKAQAGDEPSIDTMLKIGARADGIQTDIMGNRLWMVLINVGDARFARRALALDSNSRLDVYETLCAAFQPYRDIFSSTLADTNWFSHRYEATYKAFFPLKDRVRHSLNMAEIDIRDYGFPVNEKLNTAYGYPDQDIINFGESAIPFLEESLKDHDLTSVTLTQNALSYDGFEADYFAKKVNATAPTLSRGELSFFCIAMILKSRPSCYLKGRNSKEIEDLVKRECLDYDGKVSEAGIAELRKLYSPDNAFSAKPIFAFHQWEDEVELQPVYEEAWRKAQTGDQASINLILKHAEETDAGETDQMSAALWLILGKIGDEQFARSVQALGPDGKRIMEVLGAEFQPHSDGLYEKTLEETNWFSHRYPQTYRTMTPLRDRIEQSLRMTSLVYDKINTAYGYPHQDIVNLGESAIPVLEGKLDDQKSTSVTLIQNNLSYDGFDANYFVKRVNGSVPTLSRGEFSYYCIALILKGRPSCFLKNRNSREIDELIRHECLDYDGKVSEAGIAAIRKIAAKSQFDDIEEWR